MSDKWVIFGTWVVAENDAPAWVQAIGSILAILIAVGIAMYQNSKQIKRDKDHAAAAVDALLKIIRVEIEVLFEISERNIGKALAESAVGTPFLYIFPVTEHPFTIFDAVAPQMGTIADEALRSQVVRGFSIAKSYIATFRYHNVLVEEYEQIKFAALRNPDGPEALVLPGKLQVLTQYSDKLRGWHVEVKKQIELLIAVLPR